MQGIPIDELIAWNEKMRRREKNAGDAMPGVPAPIILPQEAAFDELAFIKGMENDFTLQAESLLERLHLSHLRATGQKQT